MAAVELRRERRNAFEFVHDSELVYGGREDAVRGGTGEDGGVVG